MRRPRRRFDNFDGLDAFKAKLQSENWEPVFAISYGSRDSPRTLHAVAAALGGNTILFTCITASGTTRNIG